MSGGIEAKQLIGGERVAGGGAQRAKVVAQLEAASAAGAESKIERKEWWFPYSEYGS